MFEGHDSTSGRPLTSVDLASDIPLQVVMGENWAGSDFYLLCVPGNEEVMHKRLWEWGMVETATCSPVKSPLKGLVKTIRRTF